MQWRSWLIGVSLLLLIFTALAVTALVVLFPPTNSIPAREYYTLIHSGSDSGTIYCGTPQAVRTMRFLNLVVIQKEGVGFAAECRTGMEVIIPANQVDQWITEVKAETTNTTEPTKPPSLEYRHNGQVLTLKLQRSTPTFQLYDVISAR